MCIVCALWQGIKLGRNKICNVVQFNVETNGKRCRYNEQDIHNWRLPRRVRALQYAQFPRAKINDERRLRDNLRRFWWGVG